MLGHLPYARRLVTAVLSPSGDPTGPAFQHTLHRIVTVPAPWNEAEGWRRQKLPPIAPDASDTSGPISSADLEGELATVTEPEELILYIEPEALQGEGGSTLDVVGMGLRGRWGLFGTADGTHSWWAFKAKDCEYQRRYPHRLYHWPAKNLTMTTRCSALHLARHRRS